MGFSKRLERELKHHRTEIARLAKSPDQRSVDRLIEIVKDRSNIVWRHFADSAVDALGNLRDHRAVLPMIELLEQGRPIEVIANGYAIDLRKAISDALAKIPDARAVKPLIDLAARSRDAAAASAVAALEAILSDPVSSEVSAEDLDAIAHLSGVRYSYETHHSVSEGSYDSAWSETHVVEVDCSKVRALALEEISRRGAA